MVHASDPLPFTCCPAYPRTCRHLRITCLYYTFTLISHKPLLTPAVRLRPLLIQQRPGERDESSNAQTRPLPYSPAFVCRYPPSGYLHKARIHLASDQIQSFICIMHASLSIDSIGISSPVSSCSDSLSDRKTTTC
jgi:hypothetical protein